MMRSARHIDLSARSQTNPHRSAAERWLITAPGPALRTAAVKRPSRCSRVWPKLGIGARKLRVQPPTLDPVGDGPSADAQLVQLPMGHHRVLAVGEKRDCRVHPSVRTAAGHPPMVPPPALHVAHEALRLCARLGNAGPRLLHQRPDHPRRLVLLGVPEHAQGEAALRQLDRLDHAVVGPAAGLALPSPSSSTPWWWCDFTAVCSEPTTRRASESSDEAHRMVGEHARACGGGSRGRRGRAGAGRACRRR